MLLEWKNPEGCSPPKTPKQTSSRNEAFTMTKATKESMSSQRSFDPCSKLGQLFLISRRDGAWLDVPRPDVKVCIAGKAGCVPKE